MHPTFSTENNVFWKSTWFVLCEGTKEAEYLALRNPEPCGMFEGIKPDYCSTGFLTRTFFGLEFSYLIFSIVLYLLFFNC